MVHLNGGCLRSATGNIQRNDLVERCKGKEVQVIVLDDADDESKTVYESHYVNVDDYASQTMQEMDTTSDSLNISETLIEHLQFTYCDKCDKRGKPPLYSTNKNLHCEQCNCQLQFLCGQCGTSKLYMRLRSVRSHIRRHHSPVAPLFSCNICSYETNRKASHALHIRSMHGIGLVLPKSHKCSKCEKLYKHRHHMLRHQTYCDIPKRLGCTTPGCSYITNRPDRLSQHVQDCHTDPLPRYSCLDCGRVFTYSSTLSKHRKRCGFSVTCAHCNFNAPNKSVLRSHLRCLHSDLIGWYRPSSRPRPNNLAKKLTAGDRSTPTKKRRLPIQQKQELENEAQSSGVITSSPAPFLPSGGILPLNEGAKTE